MQPKELDIDGMKIVIRPMGFDYIMADIEPPGITVEVVCRTGSGCTVWPNPTYVIYFKKLTATYGAAAILAWHQKSVVGFLPFVPKDFGMAPTPGCINYVFKEEGDENGPPVREIEDGIPTPFEELTQKVLTVGCISVKRELRRKELGTEMVKYLIAWAKEHAW